jgi:hypothetical protein
MKAMFDKPVLETYELITQQWQQLKKLKKVKVKVHLELPRISHIMYISVLTKVQYIFLVGGFAESPYMFSKIENFVELMDPTLTVIRPSHASVQSIF